MLPDDPMAVLAAAHGVVLTKVELSAAAGRKPSAVYICEGDCSCVFWPDFESDYVYPDRYSHTRSDGTHCEDDSDCGCHKFPYCTLTDPLDNRTDYIVTKEIA